MEWVQNPRCVSYMLGRRDFVCPEIGPQCLFVLCWVLVCDLRIYKKKGDKEREGGRCGSEKVDKRCQKVDTRCQKVTER